MWQLALLALASAASTPDKGQIFEGVAFGPLVTLTCSWFSNFENSRFNRYEGLTGSVLPADEAASINASHLLASSWMRRRESRQIGESLSLLGGRSPSD